MRFYEHMLLTGVPRTTFAVVMTSSRRGDWFIAESSKAAPGLGLTISSTSHTSVDADSPKVACQLKNDGKTDEFLG
jgi:hypothetical protein